MLEFLAFANATAIGKPLIQYYNNSYMVETLEASKKVQIVLSGSHLFVLTANKQLYACGSNKRGQLGLEGIVQCSSLQLVPTPASIASVVVGCEHTFLLTDEGQLYACGANKYGQLGLGTREDRSSFQLVPIPGKVRYVAAGSDHTFAVTCDGELYACGRNTYGQLGLNCITHRLTFTRVNLPVAVLSIAIGDGNTFVLTTTGELYACGDETSDQLGFGHVEYIYHQYEVDHSNFRLVPTPAPVASVTAGRNHTLILTCDGRLYGCGSNVSGQLGLIAEMDYSSFTLIPTSDPVLSVVAGSSHTIILTATGQLYGCGYNNSGQLELRSIYSRASTIAPVYPPTPAISIASCDEETIILTVTGQLYACGANADGQLGVGHKNKCHVFTPVAGVLV